MKKTGCKTAVVLVLVAMVMAGEAFAGWGGRGRGRGAGWGPGMQAGPGPRNQVTAGWPRMGARLGQGRPGRGWVAGGPYCPFSQGRGIGRGWQGRGRGAGGPGRGLQGGGWGGYGQGFGPGSMMMRRRQMIGGRGWQGPGRGAGARGLPGRGLPMQGRPMIGGRGWQGPAGRGRVPGWRPPGVRPGEEEPDFDKPAGPGGLGRRGMGRLDPDVKRPRAPREDTDQVRPPRRPRGGGVAPGGWQPPGMRLGAEEDPNVDRPVAFPPPVHPVRAQRDETPFAHRSSARVAPRDDLRQRL